MKIKRSHGHDGYILTLPREYPSNKEVEMWLKLLSSMKSCSYYILGKDVKLEILGCIECDLNNWLRQKRWYFNW